MKGLFFNQDQIGRYGLPRRILSSICTSTIHGLWYSAKPSLKAHRGGQDRKSAWNFSIFHSPISSHLETLSDSDCQRDVPKNGERISDTLEV